MKWHFFKPKGKESKVETIMVIGTKARKKNELVIEGGRMIQREE